VRAIGWLTSGLPVIGPQRFTIPDAVAGRQILPE